MDRHCSSVYILILSNVRDNVRPHYGRDRQVQWGRRDVDRSQVAYAVRGPCPAVFLARTADRKRLALFQRPRSRNGGRPSKQRALQRTSPTKSAGDLTGRNLLATDGRTIHRVKLRKPLGKHMFCALLPNVRHCRLQPPHSFQNHRQVSCDSQNDRLRNLPVPRNRGRVTFEDGGSLVRSRWR